MLNTVFNISCYNTNDSNFIDDVQSFVLSTKQTFKATIKKLKDDAITMVVQGAIGFGLGLQMYKFYGPLTEKTIRYLGKMPASLLLPFVQPSKWMMASVLSDPFMGLGLTTKILISPIVCVIGPILEETGFRGFLDRSLKDNTYTFYALKLGLSESIAEIASRISVVVISPIVFGLVHLTNALLFWCNPMLFLPQVIATIIMGVLFSLAREFTGDLYLPIGMHIGNNTLAWSQYLV